MPDPKTYWLKDPEFLVLHACWALNETTDFSNDETDTIVKIALLGFDPTKVPSGMSAWQGLIQAHDRPLHAILGFSRVTSQNATAQFGTFFREAEESSVVQAWEFANTAIGQRRPWAVGFYENNFDDTLFRVQRDPLPKDPFSVDRLILPIDVADAEELGAGPALPARPLGAVEGLPTCLPRLLRNVRTGTAPAVRRSLDPVRDAGRLGDLQIVDAARRLLFGPSERLPHRVNPVGRIQRLKFVGARVEAVQGLGASVDFQQTWEGVPVEGCGAVVALREDRAGWVREEWAELVAEGLAERVLPAEEAWQAMDPLGGPAPPGARLEYTREHLGTSTVWVPAWLFEMTTDPAGGRSTVKVHAVTGAWLGGDR